MSALVTCLQDHGWVDAKYDAISGLSVSVRPEQADKYLEDDESCKAEVGFQQVPASVALSSESLSRLYDEELKTASCLTSLGYDTSTPPSRQVFIDQYQNQKDAVPWTAYESLPELTSDEFAKVSAECPQASMVLGAELWEETFGGGK